MLPGPWKEILLSPTMLTCYTLTSIPLTIFTAHIPFYISGMADNDMSCSATHDPLLIGKSLDGLCPVYDSLPVCEYQPSFYALSTFADVFFLFLSRFCDRCQFDSVSYLTDVGKTWYTYSPPPYLLLLTHATGWFI
jgi:hypothetical protein